MVKPECKQMTISANSIWQEAVKQGALQEFLDGKKRLPGFTREWQHFIFGELFDFIPNNAFTRAQMSESGKVKNIHYGDILTKYGAYVNGSSDSIPYISKEVDLARFADRCYLQSGDIIMADTAEDETVGKVLEVVNVDCPILAGQHTLLCRPKVKFAPKFLGYYLNAACYHDQLIPYIVGTKVSSVSKASVAQTELVVPDYEEQQAIAGILSNIDSEIEALEQKLAKNHQVKKSMMQQLLTGKKRLPGFSGEWQHVRIGSMTAVFSGGTPNTSNPLFWGGTIPWMNSGELNLKIVRQVQGRITKTGMDSSSTHFVPAECVLIGLAGQGKTRGTAAFNTFPLCTNQSIVAIYPNPEKFNSKFLYYKMDTQYEKLRELSSGDGGRGGLNKKLILDYEVAIPKSVDEQAAIATVLTEMDDEIENTEKKLAKYRQVKQGMMQQLLTGNIRLV